MQTGRSFKVPSANPATVTTVEVLKMPPANSIKHIDDNQSRPRVLTRRGGGPSLNHLICGHGLEGYTAVRANVMQPCRLQAAVFRYIKRAGRQRLLLSQHYCNYAAAASTVTPGCYGNSLIWSGNLTRTVLSVKTATGSQMKPLRLVHVFSGLWGGGQAALRTTSPPFRT